MNILLSAYACFDNFGSEPGVGYRWLNRLLLDNHQITLVTSGWSYDRLVLQCSPLLNYSNLELIVIGAEKTDCHFRKFRPLYQVYLIYWQFLLRKKIKSNNIIYDVVHHITYGGVSIPSFIAKFGKNSIYGPVGGGENAPISLAKLCGFKSFVKEVLKKASVLVLKVDPFILYTKHTYKKILLKNKSNLDFYKDVNDRCLVKSEIAVPIGFEAKEVCASSSNVKRIIFSGRGVYWKGGVIAIKVIRYIREVIGRDDFVLEFYGSGKEFDKWKRISKNLKYITFNGRMKQSEYLERINSADCLVFPSYHDSSGNVILESFCRGMPVVAFNLGGPSSIICHKQFLVEPNINPDEIIRKFSEKVINAVELSDIKKHELSKFYIEKYAEDNLLKGAYL